MGVTLYTCRAATAAAATAANTDATIPAAIAHTGHEILNPNGHGLHEGVGKPTDDRPTDQHTENRADNPTDQAVYGDLGEQGGNQRLTTGTHRSQER